MFNITPKTSLNRYPPRSKPPRIENGPGSNRPGQKGKLHDLFLHFGPDQSQIRIYFKITDE